MQPSEVAGQQIQAVIKQLMRKKKVRYSHLAAALGVSESTVKRTLNGSELSIVRLEQIAGILDVDFFDLVAMAKQPGLRTSFLTEEQESFLAGQGELAHFFWLLINGMQPDDAATLASIPPKKRDEHLATLAEIGIGRFTEGGRFRLNYSWPIGFRFGGPLYKTFTETIFREFLEKLLGRVKNLSSLDPDDPAISKINFTLRVVQFVLTERSYGELMAEVGELFAKYVQVSKLEMQVHPVSQLQTASMLVGLDRSDAIADVLR